MSAAKHARHAVIGAGVRAIGLKELPRAGILGAPPSRAVEDCASRRPRMEHPRGLAGAPASEDSGRAGMPLPTPRRPVGNSSRTRTPWWRPWRREPRSTASGGDRPGIGSSDTANRPREPNSSDPGNSERSAPPNATHVVRKRRGTFSPVSTRYGPGGAKAPMNRRRDPELARGVMVAQVVLVHLVLVRIQAGQPRDSPDTRSTAAHARLP